MDEEGRTRISSEVANLTALSHKLAFQRVKDRGLENK